MKIIVHNLRGVLSLTLYVLNTLVCCTPLFGMTLLKLTIPSGKFRKLCDKVLIGIAGMWVGVNNFNQKIFSRTRIDVDMAPEVVFDDWYLVLANHQSWVDILLLQNIFHGQIPMLKFFLKKELIWVPVLGQAWWALDFPFMKRYSKKFLSKHPELRGKDIEITRQACRRFKTIPVSVMNFVEGTRFTKEKHRIQNSPYTNLLKTKAGGIAFVLAAMDNQLNTILDVTIAYPGGKKSFWDYLCGNIAEARIAVRTIPIDPSLVGNYALDKTFRTRFQTWLNRLWLEKDRQIDDMLEGWTTRSDMPPALPEKLENVA